MLTIDNVIEFCQEQFNLEIQDGDKKYHQFLERYLQSNQEYDRITKKRFTKGLGEVACKKHLADVVLYMSYILGDTPLTIDGNAKFKVGKTEDGHFKEKAERIKDLHVLFQRMVSSLTIKNLRTDSALYKLCHRLNYRNSWAPLVDELGKDSLVVEYFGREISNIDLRCK